MTSPKNNKINLSPAPFPTLLKFIILILLLYPVYGCFNGDSSKKNEISLSSHETPGKEQEEREQHISGGVDLSNEDLADLGQATDRFSETFQDQEEENTLPAAPSSAPSSVSEEVQKQYTRLPDISFAPTITERKDEGERYLLRYNFEPNTNIIWNVAHRVRKRVLMSGLETEIETVSQIERRWLVGEMGTSNEDGKENADVWPISYYIDQMILDQQETGKDPVRYDSRVDEEVPLEIAAFGTEKAVGQELSRFKIDPFGMMTEKEKMMAEYGGNPKDSRVLFPFPSEPVAVGETWTLPYTIYLQNRDKTVKTINAVLKFTLSQVSNDLAVINVRTLPISLIGDPYLEGQLAERLFTGTCRFDIASGKAVKTEIEFVRSVPDAYGAATFLDYQCTVTEEYSGTTPAAE